MSINYIPPRPEGFDYAIPDPIETRCMVCNSDGLNRTGWKPIDYIGALSTVAYAIDCPNRLCRLGLIER